jgi:DNA-binding Xre family transcriptional regulator
MQVVAKKPRINLTLEGQGVLKIVRLIKDHFPDVEVHKEAKNDIVSLKETEWYKETSSSMTAGKALKVYRSNANLTLVELSKKSGIAQSHLSDIENDKRGVGKITAQKLGDALDCNYKRFL